MKIKKLLLYATSMALLLSMGTTAYAYTLQGWKWRGGSVTYRRTANMPWIDTCKNAANSWTTSGVPFRITEGNDQSPVYIDKDYYLLRSWSGKAWVYKDGFGYGTSGYILINTRYSDDYTWSERKGLLAHEMGHIIGLGDVTSESKVLMYNKDPYRFTNNILSPQTDDINGVKKLYSTL